MDMAEEFQGGGTAWWNPAPRSLFSGVGGGGGGGGFSSPCSVAQLGGGGGGGNYDMMSNFGWPNEVVIKGKPNNHNNSVCDNNLLVFPSDMDSSLDVLGFGISPTSSTTDWNQQNLLCDGANNDGNFDSILQEDVSSGINYGMTTNSPNMMNSNTNFSSSKYNSGCSPPPPPMAALTTTTTTTASSNSSGDSSTITCEGGGGGLNTSFPMSSTTSYLIQSLFDDIVDDPDQLLLNQNYDTNNTMSPSDQLVSLNCSWIKPTTPPPVLPLPPSLQLEQNSMFINGGRALSNNNVRASLLNSLQSRSRSPTLINQKLHNSCANNLGTKVNNNEEAHDSKRNICDQPPVKRARIETPSPMPTFKVRKEKLGDRITALQQLVSPFGKTDTASVLHEAIEYIKFLHDQVNVLSAPYLKNGASIQQQQQQQQQESDIVKGNEKSNKYDLRNRGLCLVPISSTYPVAQETPVDFWTPTFGGTIFR